jgi:hypothetical protein
MTLMEKAPVTRAMLYSRLRHRLRQDGLRLRTARARSVIEAIGHLYAVDEKTGTIALRHIDLEALANELGIIQPHEEYRPEEEGR